MKTVAVEKTDPAFRDEVAAQPGGDKLKACFSCGTCTGACPVFRVESGFNPRRIIHEVLLGMRREVLSSKAIWLCARCYSCTNHCPQGVSFADIMVLLQDMAVKDGLATPELRDKIAQATEAAAKARRDCIRMLTGSDEVSKEDIVENLRKALEAL